MGIGNWLKAWEARADAWAARRLTPGEFDEALALDRLLKANAGRLLIYFVLATLLLALLLLGIKPALGPGEALVLSFVLLLAFGVAACGVWFGYRRHANKPPWRVAFFVVSITAAGAFFGAFLGRLSRGAPLGEVGAADLVRILSIGVLTGIVTAVIVIGATWIRSREARAREAALQAEAERERLAKRTAEAELKLLQAQVEPHFLFNTLANLRYLVQSGSREALPMLDHLIDYLRTALPEMRVDPATQGAPLEEPHLEAPAPLAGEPIPPLMLMTLVENAVKHGIAPVGHGRIDIRFERTGDLLRVSVADDGRGLAGEAGEGLGLANVRERLAAIHGPGASVRLAPREGGGAVATITIPRPRAPDEGTR
jgi:signal transduction histidine kinase